MKLSTTTNVSRQVNSCLVQELSKLVVFRDAEDNWYEDENEVLEAVCDPMRIGYYACVPTTLGYFPLPMLCIGYVEYSKEADRKIGLLWDMFYEGTISSEHLTDRLAYHAKLSEREYLGLVSQINDLLAEIKNPSDEELVGGFMPRWAA